MMFNDRDEAGSMSRSGSAIRRPAGRSCWRFRAGGIEVGAALARGLGCELDVVLSRKLRACISRSWPSAPISDTGEVCLNRFAAALTDAGEAYLQAERRRQMEEIERRREMVRAVRPQAEVRGRTVIVPPTTGIAHGRTMHRARLRRRAGGRGAGDHRRRAGRAGGAARRRAAICRSDRMPPRAG